MFLCVCANPASASDKKAVDLKFDGKARIGETYVLALNSVQSRVYSMKPAGVATSPQRRESKQIHAEGEVVFESLDPFVARFTIQSLNQTVDGVKTDFDVIAGAVATIRDSGVTLKNIPLGSESSASVLGDEPTSADGAKTASAETIRALVPKAKTLLNAIFSAPTDAAEQYLGKSHKAKPGEKWKVSAKPMLDAIKGYGLDLSEKDVSANAEFVGTKKIGEIDTNKVYFLVESGNVPGYDFKLEITFSFPQKGDDMPLRMERNATELVDLALPEGLPGFSGANFSCVNEDQTDLVLIRKSALTEKKKSFFNLF